MDDVLKRAVRAMISEIAASTDASRGVDAACVIIRREDGKILSVSRRDNPHDLGLPGGKVDPGETPEQTASRELFEETGLTAVRLWHVFTGIDPTNGMLVATYGCDAEGEILTSEEGIVKYIDPMTLLDCGFHEYNRMLLTKIGVI